MTTLVRLVLVATVLAACGGSSPAASVGGFSEVVAALVLRGVTVHDQVSGDDGCARVDLHDNVARLSVSMGDDPARSEVYLFRWRRPPDFASAAPTFFMCVTDFRASHPGTVIEVVEQSPWRALGESWSDALKAAVTDSLAASAGG